MKIGIIGLGYVGLPLAVAFAESGHDVVALDATPRKIESARASRELHRGHPEPSLAPLGERLRPTTRHADLASCDAVIICVPTPLTGSREPDLSYLLDAGKALSQVLQRGPARRARVDHLPGHDPRAPGTDPRGVRPRAPARDFHLAFSPERIDPGRTDYTVRTTPKLVGGMTDACTERARVALCPDLRRGRSPLLP